MAIYIQLMTLTAEGREKVLEDAESVLRAQDTIMASDIQVLGQYGVLGPYDYVGFVEAPDNEAIARFSPELGV